MPNKAVQGNRLVAVGVSVGIWSQKDDGSPANPVVEGPDWDLIVEIWELEFGIPVAFVVIDALKGVLEEIVVSPGLLDKMSVMSVVAVNCISDVLAVVPGDKEVEDWKLVEADESSVESVCKEDDVLVSELSIGVSPINVDNSALVPTEDNVLAPDDDVETLKDGALEVPVPIGMVEIPVPILVPSPYEEFRLLSGHSGEVTTSLTVFR